MAYIQFGPRFGYVRGERYELDPTPQLVIPAGPTPLLVRDMEGTPLAIVDPSGLTPGSVPECEVPFQFTIEPYVAPAVPTPAGT